MFTYEIPFFFLHRFVNVELGFHGSHFYAGGRAIDTFNNSRYPTSVVRRKRQSFTDLIDLGLYRAIVIQTFLSLYSIYK